MHVMRRDLVIPNHLSCIGINSQNRAGKQVVALAALLCHHRIRIAGSEIVEIQFRIISTRHPRLAGAMRGRILIGPGLNTRLTFTRCRVHLPLQRSRFGIARLNETRIIQMVSADTQNHVVANNHRRNSGRVIQLRIGNLYLPAFFACPGIQAHKMTVWTFEEQPVLINTHAAIANSAARVGWICVMPKFSARSHVGGPHVIRRSEVEKVIH